ncbi:MAG: hypothetical protein JWN24_3086 [Phycisphaerales bacterium]|nr:hypothetical protein [Phycisphaerales bacterium]
MSTRIVPVERVSMTSTHSFSRVVAAIDSRIGHPDMKAFSQAVSAAGSFADVEALVQKATSGSDFMEFARFDLGEILRKEHGPGAPRVLRLVIGNPLIMRQMLVHVHDAGSYAPVNVLIDERSDGVHLSYDRMASLLMPYGSAEAMAVARDLDAKVETLLQAAASGE